MFVIDSVVCSGSVLLSGGGGGGGDCSLDGDWLSDDAGGGRVSDSSGGGDGNGKLSNSSESVFCITAFRVALTDSNSRADTVRSSRSTIRSRRLTRLLSSAVVDALVSCSQSVPNKRKMN